MLCLATIAVYAQVHTFGFVAYDDDSYVYENATVKAGLTTTGAAWAFTTFHAANWHPLTWLSHMLDCELFGMNAGAHHLVNLGFHLASTVLLFIAFVRMTRRPWRSAVIAAIFALHPLHVESVAWIAERKDVLSTFLGMLTLVFYVRYTEVATARRYAAVAVTFALGLMSKSMLVTLPFVFVLVDIWPLGRLPWPPAWKTLAPRLWEKAPLFAMVAAASAVTFVAQQRYGAVESLYQIPLADRLANAAIGYVSYIGNAFWPAKLAVLYPIHMPDMGDAVAALVVLVGVTAAAFAWGRKRPYILVGWLWYVGMLVPVIGIVQVGSQSMADRYTYLPLVGLSVAVVWLAAEAIKSRRRLFQETAAVIACAALVALGAQAYRQTGYWQSSQRLFERTLAVTERNFIIENNLGVIVAREGRFDDAAALYREALAVNPGYAEAHVNLGHELLRSGQREEAFAHLTKAVEIKPQSADAQADLGILFAAQGRFEEARKHLEESLRIKGDQGNVHSNLGFVLLRLGRIDEAVAECREALEADAASVDAHYNMGMALAAGGRRAEAEAELSKVLTFSPGHAGARRALDELQKSR
jgi:Flp pilus assembly protein TadD